MIARVAPIRRMPTGHDFFDYLLPEGSPALPGSLVQIPFRNTATPGLVLSIAETSDVPPERLRSIGSVLFGGVPVLSEALVALLPRIALHYRVSVPLLLLYLLPDPGKAAETLTLPKLANGEGSAHVRFLQVETVFDGALIKKEIIDRAAEHPLLILLPTVAHAAWLEKQVTSALPIIRYDGGTKKRDAFQAWSSLLSGDTRALVTTRSGVLAPMPPDGEILLFAEEEPSFVQFDAEPRYDGRFLAHLRARAESRKLTALGEAPTLRSFLSASEPETLKEGARVELVNLSDERRGAGRYLLFSDAAIEAIRSSLEDKKNAVVCVNRKGAALVLRCQDCSEVARCEECKIPFRIVERNEMRCARCGKSRPVDERCAKCGSIRLQGRGLTLEHAATELRKLFPEAVVISPPSQGGVRGGSPIATTPPSLPFERGGADDAPSILLGTEMLIHSLRPRLEALPIGAVVVPLAEQLFGIGDYKDTEEGYATLRAVSALASRQDARCVIQSTTPEHPALVGLLDPSKKFYDQEKQERELFGYPPSKLLVELSYGGRAPDFERMLSAALPEGATLDRTAEKRYSARFEAPLGLVPESFRTLGPDWSWRVL